MIELLISILIPILGGLGVSEADVTTYVTNCAGYIYAILISIVVLLVVMIAAHFAKKGFRHVVRWGAVFAWLLAVVILVNMVCYGPLYTNLSVVLNGGGKVSEEASAASKELVTEIAEEGMILVKNNGLLPLKSDVENLNVFGWASTNPIYGGTGSGSADESANISLLQGLKNAGYNTNEDLTDMYKEYREGRGSATILGGSGSFDITLPEPTVDYYTDSVMGDAQDFSDVAVIVIGRGGGEGYDLPHDMYSVIHGTYDVAKNASITENYAYTNISYTNNGDYDDFDKGETYLELSNTEEAMIEKVCTTFDKVIVVVNANNTMELGWVDSYDSIGAVILAPGVGATGFDALGKIMSGEVNPSGRTADTFVKDLTATPYFHNIGALNYTNVSDIQEANAAADPAYEGAVSFVNYVEGIYVGYKYYETAAADGAIKYEDHVQYPFGYGLSYTTFTQEIENFKYSVGGASFDVKVTNTGDTAGKDVVEVYFTPPYTNGGIEKSAVNLVNYAKTDVLEPGASQTLSFEISKEDMASYDSEELKVAGGGYILEKGEYILSLRSDSHTVLDEVKFEVKEDISYADGRTSDFTAATNQFDYAKGNVKYLSRKDKFANFAEATAAPKKEDFAMDEKTKEEVMLSANATYDSTLYDNPDDEMPTLGADNGLKLADLTGADYDDPRWEDLLDQLTFEDMTLLVNLGGWQTAQIDSVGKVATSDSDGPAGLNNFITGTYGTQFSTETLMTQTWNPDLAYRLGEAMGQEYVDVGQYGCYGPAMNTHRSAFAGRNFEYYSEDGVLAGYFAAAETNGLASKGVYSYIKHFALNDQETNRCAYLLTYSNEQAIREIYLKPFELCVKGYEHAGMAVMSSFNWIGTVPACASSELLLTVLRDEWGFKGMVETDYNGSYGYQNTDHCVRNGNDLMLGFNYQESNQITNQSATMTKALRQSCKNILYTVGNSGYYTNTDDDGASMSNMTKMFLVIDIVAGLIIVGGMAIVIARYRKRKNVVSVEN